MTYSLHLHADDGCQPVQLARIRIPRATTGRLRVGFFGDNATPLFTIEAVCETRITIYNINSMFNEQAKHVAGLPKYRYLNRFSEALGHLSALRHLWCGPRENTPLS